MIILRNKLFGITNAQRTKGQFATYYGGVDRIPQSIIKEIEAGTVSPEEVSHIRTVNRESAKHAKPYKGSRYTKAVQGKREVSRARTRMEEEAEKLTQMKADHWDNVTKPTMKNNLSQSEAMRILREDREKFNPIKKLQEKRVEEATLKHSNLSKRYEEKFGEMLKEPREIISKSRERRTPMWFRNKSQVRRARRLMRSFK